MSTNALLENKVAIITGASRGIGRATALAFAQAGAAVILAARNGDELQALADEIRAQGGKALAIPTDVTNQADVDLLITLSIRAFRQIDILVNNAGVLNPLGKTWEVHPGEWQRLIRTNIIGPYLCVRAVLPQMLERGDGRVINVSSKAAVTDIEGWSAYCASKAALDRLTTVLAAEVSSSDIVVAGLYPGSTDTQMQADIRQAGNRFPRTNYFRQQQQASHLYRPDEPAQLILWLASEFGEDQNGVILNLDDLPVRKQIAQDLALPVISSRHDN